MKPTGPIPPHFSASQDGQLTIGGQPVDELIAEAAGTGWAARRPANQPNEAALLALARQMCHGPPSG